MTLKEDKFSSTPRGQIFSRHMVIGRRWAASSNLEEQREVWGVVKTVGAMGDCAAGMPRRGMPEGGGRGHCVYTGKEEAAGGGGANERRGGSSTLGYRREANDYRR
eukprot:GGOE01010827.1.p2 GENE.GGOE01010827.1~~GGOE01010827.1.p2  ORF type:complete len:106 (+),score=3.09 GGOE01010827.1:12-329(+)